MSNDLDLFRLNVGFIVPRNAGYTREFILDIPYAHLPPDLDLFDISGLAEVTRTARGLLIQIKVYATTTVQCVRCLEDFPHEIETEFTELYVFDAEQLDDESKLLPDDGKIDIGPLIREEVLVAIPINPLCRVDCKGLCPVCGEDQNETICNHGDEPIDPRLEVLKSFLIEDTDD
ncbi:MAG: DUF177 domain-containing protein [Chloroflexota bacterium]|nr:DUF177 domain-containing protein [Chloroflexota bacterium]